MSSLLEQAILDAKELKEAAVRNAQQAIVEKYSAEFEGEIERLLEQTEVPPTAPPVDPSAPAMPPAMPMAATGATASAQPVDPEKAKDDSDAKSDLFGKLQYAFKDGEIIDDKAYPTGVVEIDLDSLSEFGFENNKKESVDQMALQELRQLMKRPRLKENNRASDDDEWEEIGSDDFPYGKEDTDLAGEDEFCEECGNDVESCACPDLEGYDDDDDSIEGLDEYRGDKVVGVDEEEEDLDDDFDSDEELDDGMDDDFGEEEDSEGEENFEIDFDSEPVKDGTDLGDETSVEDDDFDSDDDFDDIDDDEEDFDDDDILQEDELNEAAKKQSLAVVMQKLINMQGKVEKKHPGLGAELKYIIDMVKELDNKTKKPSADKKAPAASKDKIDETIKLDWKRSGPRSKWTGVNPEEAEHDVELANLQAEIQEMEQEVETLEETNKKLKAGLGESIALIENVTKENQRLLTKISRYEKNVNESRFLNHRLLYINKALMDGSLNERQKNKIVESINGAKTTEEVKLLYETLQSTMRDATSNSGPKSLSEAVERRSSSILLRASRAEDKPKDDFAERMKRLAGI